jgi:lipopolysaccharide/colanic/teichoic acid biosynthesis glycosyltransferase
MPSGVPSPAAFARVHPFLLASGANKPVYGRSTAGRTLSWDDSVRLDLRYVENWSFVLDLQILWKTCFAVVRGAGAY